MTAEAVDLSPEVHDLLGQAAEWRLLGLLFECPSPRWREQLGELAPEVGDAQLRRTAEAFRTQADEGTFHSTFGPGGPAPPREATYRDTLQLGYLMSELNAFYQAFGYEPSAAEAADHISVEAGFVGYLKLKQAFALTSDDADAARVARDAEREFIAEHLASIAEPMGASLSASGIPYLAEAGLAIAKRCGPAKKRFLVLPQDDREVTCGDQTEEEIL